MNQLLIFRYSRNATNLAKDCKTTSLKESNAATSLQNVQFCQTHYVHCCCLQSISRHLTEKCNKNLSERKMKVLVYSILDKADTNKLSMKEILLQSKNQQKFDDVFHRETLHTDGLMVFITAKDSTIATESSIKLQ